MARARSLASELPFPRAAARSRRRLVTLSPSHPLPLPRARRVYSSFPPLQVASEKQSFADLQRERQRVCQNLNSAVIRCHSSAERLFAKLLRLPRNGHFEGRWRRYRVIGRTKGPIWWQPMPAPSGAASSATDKELWTILVDRD